jgi:arginyl-tRNA synthetase
LAQLGRLPALIVDAAAQREPHQVVFYLADLSKQFQSYFTRLKGEGDAILPLTSQMQRAGWEERWDKDKTLARLVWVKAIQTAYRAGLDILGITALERMERLSDASEANEEDA